MNNEEILKLFIKKDDGAIDELSQLCGAKMKAAAMNVLHNEQDAEECVNDAYLKLWNSIPEVLPDDISAYACSVARNTAMQRYRYNTAEKRNAVTVSLDAELSEVISDNSDDNDNLKDAVNGFLKSLSKPNRILFMRRYYFSDSYADIATQTGLTEKNVSVRLTRLRAKMKNYLTERDYVI